MKLKQSRRKLGELTVVACFVVVAGIVFQQSFTFLAAAGAASGGALDNAARYPELLAVGLIILSITQAAKSFFGRNGGEGMPSPSHLVQEDQEPAKTPLPDSGSGANAIKVLLCLAAIVAYLLSLKTIGYHIATPVLMALIFVVLGIRAPVRLAVLSVGASLIGAVFFGQLLNVVLPVGVFEIAF